MPFFQNTNNFSKIKIVSSVFILITVAIIVLISFGFIETKVDLKNMTLLLSFLLLLMIFPLFYFSKNQFKREKKITELQKIITELELKLDTAIDTSDHKTIYLANISHEIRTPLNTVLGMLTMLKETNLDADQKAQVEIAEYSSEHLLQLVNMILDNSEVGNNTIELNLVTINLKSDLTKLFKVFEYQAWEKGLELEFRFLSEEKQKFSVLGDSIRIQQVLINLINNAVKFTNSGKITIIVDQTVGIDGEQIVTFYVKDTGVGMRAYEVKNIFEASKELDTSTMRDYRGSGMGLLISHQLVKLMGGELKIESKENEGTTFYFSLQLKKTLNLENESSEFNPILLNKFNVLVAEDNRMNQKVIKFLLEQQGADCTFAKNGLEAVDLYKILDFDMVFMDIYMPGMDGYEATKKIKRTKKFSEVNTPIIAVSASAFEDDINKAKESGINDFLAKPIEVEKLKELLVKYASVEKPA